MKAPINIQDKVQKIHSKFGTSELANYKVQLLFDDQIKTIRETYEKELIDFAKWIPEHYDIHETGKYCKDENGRRENTKVIFVEANDLLTQFRNKQQDR